MLIGNYSVLSKDPGRSVGGGAIGIGMNRRDFNKSSQSRGRFGGEAAWEAKSGVPDGYRPPYCWLIPLKDGGLAARNNVAGEGDILDLNLAGGKSATATLTGVGSLTATGALIISMVAALTGSGAVSNAAAQAFLSLAAALAGAGDLTGARTAIGHAAAALTASGTATATATALGTLAAEITVTGDLLTTANVGDAVWAVLIEAGLTAQQAMRVIAAAMAGKSTGGATSTITFRNAVADSKDRIIATVDGDGNRTAITTDVT